MAISKQKKQEVVQQTKKMLQDSSIVIFTDVATMDVVTLTQLRHNIRAVGGKYSVVKKNLLALALDIKDVDPKAMQGEIAIATGGEDATGLAKTIYLFHKEHEKPAILSGAMDGEVLDLQHIQHLATLPSREELLARIVGSINAPVSNFVGVCRATVSSVVYALSAIQEQKQ